MPETQSAPEKRYSFAVTADGADYAEEHEGTSFKLSCLVEGDLLIVDSDEPSRMPVAIYAPGKWVSVVPTELNTDTE